MNTKIIKIIGAGPTGSLLAIALSTGNTIIELNDSQSINCILNQQKTYAITHSTKDIMKLLGIWDSLSEYLNPFRSLVLRDNVINKNIIFNLKDLSLINAQSNSIGWVVEHKNLMNVLLGHIKQKPNIDLKMKASVASDITGYDFCFAADGLNSKSRALWGMKNITSLYPQSCITFQVILRGVKEETAYEIFTKQGPLAILPLGGSIYQIIWTASTGLSRNRLTLNSSYLLDELASCLPYGIEPDQLLDTPKIFQTAISLSFPIVGQNKNFLVGESAHSLHPVGGQGLNLSYRDISSINSLINKSNQQIRSSAFIFYQVNRLFDIFSTLLLTDTLIRLFSNNYLILKPIKYLIFYILKKYMFIRKLILSLMTNGIISTIITYNTKKKS